MTHPLPPSANFPGVESRPRSERGVWSKRLLIFAFWTGLAFFFATRDVLTRRSLGLENPWPKAIWWKAMEWYGWAILSVGIFYLCSRFYRAGKPWWPYALMHLGAGTLFSLAHVGICSIGAAIEAAVLETGLSWTYLYKLVFLNHFHFDWLVYAALVCAWHALDSYRRARLREVQAAELETRLARAQLATLRAQLQPHFLFNTLNSISVLNHEDPKAANRMLARLSNLLRLSLDKDCAQEVTLKEELDFLTNYIEIEKVRLGNRLSVHMDVAADALDMAVPNLLLQPIVENAIRYGISPFTAPGAITITARRNGARLHLEVIDTGKGLDGQASSSGVGLANTRERLQRLYGEEGALACAKTSAGGWAVQIELPCRSHAKGDVL